MTKEIEAAKVISEIYFEIAAEAIGEKKLRELRDKKLKQRSEAGQHETIVISDSLKENIFSDELNQRITATVNDDDYPNDGSVIAGLVQEEIFDYLSKK